MKWFEFGNPSDYKFIGLTSDEYYEPAFLPAQGRLHRHEGQGPREHLDLGGLRPDCQLLQLGREQSERLGLRKLRQDVLQRKVGRRRLRPHLAVRRRHLHASGRLREAPMALICSSDPIVPILKR